MGLWVVYRREKNIVAMNSSRALIPLVRTTARTFTSTAVRRETAPGYSKIKSKYEYYQCDNGVPIHLKGGHMDRILFSSTLILNAIGMYMIAKFVYEMSFPKKPE